MKLKKRKNNEGFKLTLSEKELSILSDAVHLMMFSQDCVRNHDQKDMTNMFFGLCTEEHKEDSGLSEWVKDYEKEEDTDLIKRIRAIDPAAANWIVENVPTYKNATNLDHLMTWEGTPQGHKYWEDLGNQLEKDEEE